MAKQNAISAPTLPYPTQQPSPSFLDGAAAEVVPKPARKTLDALLLEKNTAALLARRKSQQERAQAVDAERERLAKKQRIRELVEVLAATFMSADLGSDQKLDFDEFQAHVPERICMQVSISEMREVFEMADGDQSGFVSREEYFFWMLRWMAKSGEISGLEHNFTRFDESGDGELNRHEWAMAVDRFGFGEYGSAVFTELDEDKTGAVSYVELLDALAKAPGKLSHNCQRMLTAMAFDSGDTTRNMSFDTTSWKAQSIDELRGTLRDRMFEQLATPNDVWSALLAAVGSLDRRLTEAQFVNALSKVFGFTCSTDWEKEVVECAYTLCLDDDGTGQVTFDEFLNWMNCRAQRRQRARSLTLQWRPRGAQPLHKIAWTPAILRAEIQSLLKRGNVGVLDLLMAHDNTDDGKLDQREFLTMMRALIASDHTWKECGAHKASKRVFRAISGADCTLDIQELELWLLRGVPASLGREHKVGPEQASPSRSCHHLQSSMSLPRLPAAKDTRTLGAQELQHARRHRLLSLVGLQTPPQPSTEERSAEGILAGHGLAARWLLRNASVNDVLEVRQRQQLRYVPGGMHEVASATSWDRPAFPQVPPRVRRERVALCRRARLGLRTPAVTATGAQRRVMHMDTVKAHSRT